MDGKDLFGNRIINKPVKVNIYGDEIQPIKCPYTKEKWFYIGILVENTENPLLPDIIDERYCGNLEKNSPFFDKNNRILHWSKVKDIDTKNIAKRWIKYILDTQKSAQKFYAYILGINDSKLDRTKFANTQEFNSKYNRFFRSAVLYGLKRFFPKKKIIVENIFHEVGQQQYHEYFPWHIMYKVREENIFFNCDRIIFLPKSHQENERSNLIQLIDLVMGLCKDILHGIKENKKNLFKIELINLFLPLFKRMIEKSENKNSSYKHANRIIIKFFPKNKLETNDLERYKNQFYTRRKMIYVERSCGIVNLPFE